MPQIGVSESTKEYLKSKKREGETYDAVVNRLIDRKVIRTDLQMDIFMEGEDE